MSWLYLASLLALSCSPTTRTLAFGPLRHHHPQPWHGPASASTSSSCHAPRTTRVHGLRDHSVQATGLDLLPADHTLGGGDPAYTRFNDPAFYDLREGMAASLGLGLSGLGPLTPPTMTLMSEPSGHARPHQKDAVRKIYQHYQGQDHGDHGDHGGGVGSAIDGTTARDSHRRATVVLPPGAGKTLVGLWAMEAVTPSGVCLVVLPSLMLIDQTLAEYKKFSSSVASGRSPVLVSEWSRVAGRVNEWCHRFVGHVCHMLPPATTTITVTTTHHYTITVSPVHPHQKVVASDGDSDVQRTTKVDDISTFLAEAMDKTTSVDGGPMLNIIFSTYDSLPKVAEAQVSDK